MDILKDRAIWIVVVVMFIAGAMYMVIVDPSRVDKMDNIVERDDERIADVTETNELIDRIDKKLIGTKKHLQILRDEFDSHLKAYDSKVDSVNNAFSKVDLSINKIIRDMKDKFAEVQDQLEELEDEISGVKTQTKRDSRAIKKEIADIKDAIKEINEQLE